MTGTVQPDPFFPGGRDSAPEATHGGCGHSPCLCLVEPGRRFCCSACARASEDEAACHCGHSGCAHA